MYGLSENADLSFFIGKTLVQACFGVHDLILNFADDVSVTVTSSLGYIDIRGCVAKHDDFRQAAAFIMSLLNKTVLSAKGVAMGTLTIRFESGECLSLYDDSKDFESYMVRNGKRSFVV